MTPLQQFPPFEEFPALGEALNVMIERINALTPRGGPGVKVRFTPAGTCFEAAPGTEEGGSAEIREITVESVEPDTLIGGGLEVLKARELRRTLYDGQSVTYVIEQWPQQPTSVTASYVYKSNTFREVTILSAIEQQIVIPRWVTGVTKIYAIKLPDDTWLDLNVAGRAWARV